MKVDISVGNDRYDVQIDSDDLWSLDYTLSKIIYPALVKFKEEETGCGPIDKEDVPEYLHSTYGTPEDYSENYSHEAWIWVIDEMIWGFRQMAENTEEEPENFRSSEYKEYVKRRGNALRLFGKYLNSLWN